MKTEYQARGNGVKCQWTGDLSHVRENYRASDTQLWRRETETPEEAAMRRMDWLERRCKETVPMPNGDRRMSIPCGSTVSDCIDRTCPPPPATETRLEWDTLEPWKEVPVWVCDGVWIAGVSRDEFQNEDDRASLARLTGSFASRTPTAAIGATREAALRNLEEMRRTAK
jgi:hypothetical protein